MFKKYVLILASILYVQSNAYAFSYADYEKVLQDEAYSDTLSDEEYQHYIDMMESGGEVEYSKDSFDDYTLQDYEEETRLQNDSEIIDINNPTNVVKELQDDVKKRVANRGKWGVHFLYVSNKDKSVKVLSEYNARTIVKPASTLKIFTGWLAFLNKSYSSIGYMLKTSNNAMADNALRSVAKKNGYKEIENNGIDELKQGGVKIMKTSYANLDDASKFNPVNGSGLNTTGVDTGKKLNLVTARLETHLLQKIHASGKYNEFKKLLAQPHGQGTLKRRLTQTNSLAKIYAKTGTLAKTKSLAGFADTKKGVLIFAVIGDELKIGQKAAMDHIDSMVYKHVKYLVNQGL